MRTLICCLILIVPVLLFAATPVATVNVHTTAGVAANTVYLADVSDINGAPKDMAAKLNAVELGRAPLDGVTRSLTVGDISLKLRQAGIDPATVSFSGAASVTISLSDTPAAPPTPSSPAAQTPSAQTPSANPAPSAPVKPVAKVIVVHPGDAITALYQDGPVSITVHATAESGGCVGDLITVQTSVSGRTLRGEILDADTVSLKD